jgi:hypothetical protein
MYDKLSIHIDFFGVNMETWKSMRDARAAQDTIVAGWPWLGHLLIFLLS